MINVLIVDDEYYAVKGLISGVRWDRIGVDEVYEAYHASAAQRILSERNVDIMICDIEMPDESGLELMSWARDNGLNLETIVVTCHSEFAYAQKALQLGGCDYLLKPVIYTDMEEVVRRAILKVEEKRKASLTDERYREYVRLWNRQRPLLIERFWQDLLDRRISASRSSIEASLSAYELPIGPMERVCPILISIESWEKTLNERDEDIMEFALRKAAEEMILSELPGDVIQDHRGNSLVMLYAGERPAEEERVRALCSRFIEACRRYFYCSVSCYVGETVPIAEIWSPYLALLDAEYRNVSRTAEVILCRELRPSAPALPPEAFGCVPEWAEWLERGNAEAVLAGLDAALDRVPPAELTADTLKAFYHALMQCIYYVLYRRGRTASQLAEEGNWPDAAAVAKSLSGFKRWAEEAVRSVVRLPFAPSGTASPVIQKIKTYVLEHLDQELSREELASYVYLNPAYLSRLFRKETGMVLTEYILREKMRRASELLLASDRSISEIAESLGYGNFSYFARLFRKVYGVTPHEYRKSLRKSS
ncbi:helix-turn-helix domain-containing protein [Cohnella sp.]|uniref:response regulator transcription factor n=1 Tax=Cohnella sp. TaxID=1883426 RepID=UPI00257BFD5F|nr:helix-turn-helix domain-containing protein [Cohnella sp.]